MLYTNLDPGIHAGNRNGLFKSNNLIVPREMP